jgi:DNA-binding transcriptional ArsR family regulator
MSDMPNFSLTASLIADPARAIMLTALIDGRALPAGELAYSANITPQTASSHLARLLSGGLVTVETEGRHRYYRLAGTHVAEALEQLSAIRPDAAVRRKALSRKTREMRFCRCCYDHLAGQVGVALAKGLEERGYIVAAGSKAYEVTPRGMAWFAGIGLDVPAIKPTKLGLARQCLDCTERMHHLAGPLGVQLLSVLCDKGWLRRNAHSRIVTVTPLGWRKLRSEFGIDTAAIAAADARA